MTDFERVSHERLLHRAILAGDESAWNTLYNDSYDALAGYVRWRCGGVNALADDVIQETWLTAVRRIDVFNPVAGSFQNWLRGIASNVLKNQLRQAAARGAGALESDPAVPDEPGMLDVGLAVAGALASLPEHYEQVLRAKYVDRMSVDEIARHRDESPKATESLLTRARQMFRQKYRPPE